MISKSFHSISAYVGAVVASIRSHGVVYTFKKYGWRLVAAVIIYYLVRDVIIYIVLPYSIYLFVH